MSTDSEADEGREAALERILEHEDAVAEIASSSAQDAHVARVLLALARGEDPNPDDLERLTERATERQVQQDVLAAPAPAPSPSRSLPPERVANLAQRLLEQVRQHE